MTRNETATGDSELTPAELPPTVFPALRIHPDEAAAGLIISHGSFLARGDFALHIETAAGISDGTPMAWIDWDAVIAAGQHR